MGYGTLVKKQFTVPKLSFYIIFWSIHFFLFGFGWYKQASDPRLAGLNGLEFSVWISRGAGLVLSFDGLFILLPVAYAMLFFTVAHVTAHYVNFFNVERTQIRPVLALQIHYAQAGGITGHIMLLCMLLMYTTAHHRIRQQSFETFWYTHHLFIPFMLGLYTHAVGCFVRDTANAFSPFAGDIFWTHCIGYQGWRWETFGGGIYLTERLYREIRARRSTKITRVVRHPYDVVEIQFSKPSFKYKAGQWLFLQLPSVSKYQWHPFTITSCPYDPYVSVHVRQVGDFTRSLGDAVGAGGAQAKLYEGVDPMGMYEVALQNGQQMPALRIDGPYGAPAEDVFENEIAVLVGTGIGVTPWAAILKNIWHLRNSPNPPTRLRRVEFLWICKDTNSFEWFQTLLSSLEQQSTEAARIPGSSGVEFLKIHTYLTQKLDQDTMNNIVLNSVGAEVDPLTELKSRTNFGRPDFSRLFTTMRDGILDRSYLNGLEGSMRTTVGVYFCGPSAAARDIKKACKAATVREVDFRFWKEHF
ncbi:putative nadph oxidase [Diaporthe ampelina]|uniref:Putative nadph oxidase n=1 Tax=Diaporthe ampelina TaxID=1214573 RepID=A0A0G2HWW9_9PEZI|nr:putative nadph oxidase [Diaporthe ampelina]